VLVVRVHPEILSGERLPENDHVWKHRYRAINEWERYLTDNGFRVVRLFLNLSKEEQRTRFLRRIDLPEHNWKFSSHDLPERRHWDAYHAAFSEMFTHTRTEWAPPSGSCRRPSANSRRRHPTAQRRTRSRWPRDGR
jgi:polyphosphate kinase 2 (PPK2 family)